MKSKIKIAFAALFLLLTATGCKNASNSSDNAAGALQGTGPGPDAKFASIVAPDEVDMGYFDYKTPVKTTDIEFSNAGSGDLCINHVVADCECTQILSVDTIVAPQGKGKITVSLDMSKYLTDTIYKTIRIISNDPDKHVFEVTLVADNHM